MAGLWQTKSLRRLGIPIATLLVSAALSGCLGWSTQLSTTDGASFNGIACPSPSNCLVVGTDAVGKGTIVATHDGGASWLPLIIGVPSAGLNAIACPDTDHCVAVGASNAVFVTTDGGTTWNSPTTVPSGANHNLTSVSCPDDQHCWAIDAGGVIATNDGGATWSALSWSLPPSFEPQTGALDAIACPTTTDCVSVGSVTTDVPFPPGTDETTTSSGFYQETTGVTATSSDGGRTWQSQLLSFAPLTAVSCPTLSFCVTLGPSATAPFTSTDGGTTWTQSLQSDPSNGAPNFEVVAEAVTCADTGHCTVVGHSNGAMYSTPVIATLDGGVDWSNQATNNNGADLHGVACATPYSCWAAGSTSGGGMIVHTVSGGVSDPTVTASSRWSDKLGAD